MIIDLYDSMCTFYSNFDNELVDSKVWGKEIKEVKFEGL